MIFKNRKQIIRHHYTIVELLVVLVIAGLLTGMTMSGIKGALARQGATGAVRTLANKISLAQSFAVSRNRYVALIVPDYDQVVINPDENYEISNKTEANTWNNYSSCFTKNRLCYVTKDSSVSPAIYVFDRWVDGYEWQTLPPKTIAFICEKTTGDDSTKSVPIQVTNVPDPTHPADPPTAFKNSTALIFKPSGTLVGANQIIVRIFRAAYVPYQESGSEKVFYWQGTETEDKGWKVVINGFTGRSRFYLGGESIED